ncbi:hypothetical protein DQ392_04815 [Streptomyces reniochalinae]|uniref:Secreted protein n=1 Tax=Streptomyces reniochalinae TaxID=2250578 RepID=A0A367F0M5_9ACTN|nr:hypothetical protein DQ392_04815 [Streptomyces reniochalinae]
MSLILLCAAAVATALGGAALHTARGLRRQLTALRTELEAGRHDVPATAAVSAAACGTTAVPHARTASADEARAAAAAEAPTASEEESDAETAGPFSRQIRAAVAAALADERERELAEARAFWAAQEARGDAGAESGALLAGHGTEYEIAPGDPADGFTDPVRSTDGDSGDAGLTALADFADPTGSSGSADFTAADFLGAADFTGPTGETPAPHGSETGQMFIPRQPGPEDADMDVDLASFDAWDTADTHPGENEEEPDGAPARPSPHAPDVSAETDAESPDLAAARRRHPSQPDYTLSGEPVAPHASSSPAPTVTYHERTIERLAGLAEARTPLSDVRPGPLGTLDVYLFEDGTTVCLSPGHRATSEALADAVRRGEAPVLMGGSGISGSYTLTFGYPDGSTAYLLADRVITPL